MQPENQQSVNYDNGSEMWRDNALSCGIDEAVRRTRNYLDLNLSREHPRGETQFCRELFAAMYHATADKTDATKIVYPFDYKTANERLHGSFYHASRKLNNDCAAGIDRLISDSWYETFHYNLEIAAMLAVLHYGFPRVCAVLAFNFQNKKWDARFSTRNREWSDGFIVQEKAFDSTWLKAHPTLIDSFCRYIREMYTNFGAENFALPGNKEHGEFVTGFEIKRAIIVSDNGNGFLTGYAIGHNPNAVSRWVCWQFAVRSGERHYNHGDYCDEEQQAVDSYNARVFVALYK